MTSAGYPIERSVIAKIEAGGTRTDNVSLDEALAFAAVLGMSPLHLFVEQDDELLMAVMPKLPEPTYLVRGWVRGDNPLQLQDEQFFWYMSPPKEWKRNWEKPAPSTKSLEPKLVKGRKP
jgi:hypothetical protein